MFRKKDRTPEQRAAKPTYAGSNANTMRNVGGAYGFSSGVGFGVAIGGGVGALVGATAGLGVGALVTTPIGMAIGGAVGGGGGAGLGRWVGKKLEKVAAEDQKDIFGLQAEDNLTQELVEPGLKKEINAIKTLITLLVQMKVVTNTRSDFFNQVDPQILGSVQKQLFNALLDEYILDLQIQANWARIAKWGDSIKASVLREDLQIELLQFKKKVASLTTEYKLEIKGRVRGELKKVGGESKNITRNRTLDHLLTLVLSGLEPAGYHALLNRLNEAEVKEQAILLRLFSNNLIVDDEEEKEEKYSAVRWHDLK